MFTGIFFMIVIAAILYGLVNSTEKVLACHPSSTKGRWQKTKRLPLNVQALDNQKGFGN